MFIVQKLIDVMNGLLSYLYRLPLAKPELERVLRNLQIHFGGIPIVNRVN